MLKFHIFLNASFLVKEGTNDKTLDITLFARSRAVGKYLFRCSRPNDTEERLFMSRRGDCVQSIFLHKFHLCMQ